MQDTELKKAGRSRYVWIAAAVILAALYFWPRFLVATFGVDSHWTSYLYKYGFGAVFFFSGVFIVLKGGACNLKRPHDRYWFRFLIFGFFWYLIMHGLWILNALLFPLRGEV